MLTVSEDLLYADDNGVYQLAPLGGKIYLNVDEATGVVTTKHATNFFHATAKLMTAALQGIDVKSPVHNGVKSDTHVPYWHAKHFPGGVKGALTQLKSNAGSFHLLKQAFGNKGWIKDGKLHLKHKDQTHVFDNLDAAWQWAAGQGKAA